MYSKVGGNVGRHSGELSANVWLADGGLNRWRLPRPALLFQDLPYFQ